MGTLNFQLGSYQLRKVNSFGCYSQERKKEYVKLALIFINASLIDTQMHADNVSNDFYTY